MFLETPRLLLIETPLHVWRARLESGDFTAPLAMPKGLLHVHFSAEWPGDLLPLVPHLVDTFDPAAKAWGGTLVHKADRVAIGQMGFKGGPDPQGDAELGYGLNPSAWGRGFASEMLLALVSWGRAQKGVRRVTAKTRPDNHASIRVLEKSGFARIGTARDPEDGALIVWALP